MIEKVRGIRVLLALAALPFVPGLAWAEGDAPAGDLQRGAALFDLCAQCHGAEAQGNPDIQAPSIAGLPAWYVQSTLKKFQAGGRGTHPQDVAGMRMRPMSMWLRSDDDVAAVSAWVASLPIEKPEPMLEGGNASNGAALYAVCMACHMPDGGGNPALGSPPLNHASDWYLLAQLKKFKGGIRGSGPNDANGAIMVGMSQTLADEQAMKDVIAHIMTLAD